MNQRSLSQIIGRLPQREQLVKLKISGKFISGIEKVEQKGGMENFPYLAPGFIDNQVNGYMGVDFTQSGLTRKKIKKVTKALWRTGVTSYLPTLITGDPSITKGNLSVLAEAMQEAEIGDSIPGFHLEGPYINSEDGFRGAHNKRWTHAPDWEEFVHFNNAAKGGIRQITLAPELDGAPEFIRSARDEGIIVALGHHNASSEQVAKAAKAGASISTHLGNGCANMIHRHHNPLWPQLANEALSASIIVDGHHLTCDEVRTFYKVKGRAKLILISDMTKLAGLPAGEYEWNGKEVVLNKEGQIKYPDQDVLAGSSLTLREGIENMIRFTGCSLSEALQLVTVNPARLNTLDDRGTLEKGKRADLVLFSFQRDKIQINRTIIGGKLVYESNES